MHNYAGGVQCGQGAPAFVIPSGARNRSFFARPQTAERFLAPLGMTEGSLSPCLPPGCWLPIVAGSDRCNRSLPATIREERKFRLEHEAQRHLNLPRASDRFRHLSQAAGAVEEIVGRTGGATSGRARRGRWRGCRARLRKLAEGQVLRDVIDGDVEAGRIRQIENVKGVFQRKGSLT